MSHRSITNNSALHSGAKGLRTGDTFLNVMPMFHTSGCAAAMLGSVQWGCRLIMVRQFDPQTANFIIESQRVNLTMAVPTMLNGMLEAHAKASRDFSSLRVILSGGAMVPPELVRNVADQFGCKLVVIFGQTETSPGLTQTRTDDSFEDQTDTVGQAFPRTELSIRDVETNSVAPVGTVGGTSPAATAT